MVAWLAGARWRTSSGGLETREQLSLPATCGQPAVAKLLLEICHLHAGVVSHGRASESGLRGVRVRVRVRVREGRERANNGVRARVFRSDKEGNYRDMSIKQSDAHARPYAHAPAPHGPNLPLPYL